MTIEEEIKINEYGQGLIDIEELAQSFEKYTFEEKQKYLMDIMFLILQSKTQDNDILWTRALFDENETDRRRRGIL